DDDTKVTTLKNGLRVATETIPHAETATVGVWIDAGSRYEDATTNGTAHFLEHMAFKGTKARTAAGLEEEIENMGGHLNAYTSREQTTYYAKVLKKDVGAAVDILSDILQNSALEKSQIERERGVILREMEEVEKDMEEVLFDHLHATAFQQTSLGTTILGSDKCVRSVTQEDLQTYIKTHYTAPRMVLVGTGAVNHDELVKLAESSFAGLPTEGASTEALVSKNPGHFTGSEVRIRDDDMTTCHFAVAFKGASWTSPDAVPLMVMQAMLGSWDKHAIGAGDMMSPLAQAFNANELGKSFMAFNTNYADTGLFGVYVSSDNLDGLDDTAFAVMREFQNLIYGPEESDVLRAKEALKSSLSLHAESGTSALAEEVGRQLLTYGKRMSRAELFARIDAVNVETVKATAWKYIRDQELAIAAIGPTQFLPDYLWFRTSTYNNFY
ncbi:Metalloenzyme, LuxS/M16 peptidase-like, partial [Ostreococcus tauri]